jgi:hypothetical protein
MAAMNDKSNGLYTELFQQVSDERWLRSCTGSFSCKFSAIQYIIIHYLIDKIGEGIVTKQNILSIIRSVIDAIIRRKYRTPLDDRLYQIITNNGSNSMGLNYGKEVTGIKSIPDKIVYAGLVCPSYDNPKHLIINHYFLIIRNDDGTITIVSSYGSDDVSIMQSTVILDVKEFDEFIRALQVIKSGRATREYTIEISREIIRDFMKKYFLSAESFREKEVDPNNTGGRTHTNISLIDKEVEIYASPAEGRGFHIDSYDIVPTLHLVIENELIEFSRGRSAAGAAVSENAGSASDENNANDAGAANEGMSMGGGNSKSRKSKRRKSKRRKSKDRKSKRRKSKDRKSKDRKSKDRKSKRRKSKDLLTY